VEFEDDDALPAKGKDGKQQKKKQQQQQNKDDKVNTKEKTPAIPPSSLVVKDKAMQERIKKLESQSLTRRAWQLLGEADMKSRPTNSLLSTTLEYEHQTRAALPVTEETTKDLEKIIKDRIKANAFDDVVRVIPRNLERFRPRAQLLDHEKSKTSLAEAYEKEFAQQVLGQKPVDKLREAHNEIQEVWESLSAKLDALTQFHFAPPRISEEIKVKPNVAALHVEEAMPDTMNDSSLLAPEEVYKSKDRGMPGPAEMTREDRHKKRVTHKRRAATKRKHKDVTEAKTSAPTVEEAKKKLKTEGGRNVVVAETDKQGISYTKSTQFFARIQQHADAPAGAASKKKDKKVPGDAYRLRM